MDVGVVELSWQFVDRDGTRIFPGGQLELEKRDACNLPGRLGGDRVEYDLDVQVSICDEDCGNCDDPACLVMNPLRFSCETFRGSDPDVPSSEQPYLFFVQPIIDVDRSDVQCIPDPSCVATPGPRRREVRPGLVTDLAVYQFVVDIELNRDEVLNLEACGCA